jgi:acetyl/propionyl-CoA carboxylase alpha subunit
MPKHEPFNLHVNGRFQFDLLPDDVKNLDIHTDADGRHHLLLNGKAYHVDNLELDYHHRRFLFRIGGNRYEVNIHDHYDRLVKQLGLHAGSGQKINAVKAPMPGLVLNILVEPGQDVQKGDPILILEAMKMENVLKAAGDGRVKAVKVNKGQPVDKGMLLIEME